MFSVISVLYIIVALAGVYMLVMRLMKKNVNIVLGIIHGFLGLIGIALLIIVSSYGANEAPVEAIMALFITFLIGGGIFSAKVFAGKFSIRAAIIHAIAAIVSILLLFLL